MNSHYAEPRSLPEPAHSPAPVAALLVAAGRGLRAGRGAPKQYRLVDGHPVLARALAPFLAEPAISRVVVVIGEGDDVLYADAVAGIDDIRLAAPTPGGTTRQDSVRRGLRALARDGFDGIVLVHDAARPFVSLALIGAAIGKLGDVGMAAIPALPVTDTVKQVEEGYVGATIDRDGLVVVTSPIVLPAEVVAALDGLASYDFATLAGELAARFPVVTIEAPPEGRRVGSLDDVRLLEALTRPA